MSVIDPGARISVPEHVAHRPFGDETVLLNLQTGDYHGLNRNARRFFERLVEHGRIDRAAEAVAADFAAPLETVTEDLAELCEQLLARGLIEVA